MKIKIIILINVIVLIFAGAYIYFVNNSKLIQNLGEYISFTVLYMTDYDEANDKAEYETAVYEYDPNNKKTDLIFKFPLSAMYALGVYDKKSDSVYYVKEKNNNTHERRHISADQIYRYNIAEKSDTMLTDDLLAVNDIIPVDDAVFFIAARQSNPDSVILGKIDLSDGSVKYWNEPDDLSIETVSVDRIQERIYVSVFNIFEVDNFFYECNNFVNNEESILPPYTFTVYSFDYNLEDKKEVLRKDNMEIVSLYAMDNTLLYRADTTTMPGFDRTAQSQVIDITDMKVLFEDTIFHEYRGSFTMNKRGVYEIGEIGDQTGILYYDFTTQEYTPLITTQEYTPLIKGDSYGIANFQLMY